MPLIAQAEPNEKFRDLIGQGGGTPNFKPVAGTKDPQVDFRLTPTNAKPGDEVTFSIHVRLPTGGFTYGIGGEFGGRTHILVTETDGLTPVDEEFSPDHEPKINFDENFNIELAKHLEDVTWSKRYRLDAAAKIGEVKLAGKLRYQVCDSSSCRPFTVPFQLTLGEGDKPSATVAAKALPLEFEQRPKAGSRPGPATIRVQLAPENAKPGDEITLSISNELDDGWHTYSLTQNRKNAALPTAIKILEVAGLEPIDEDFAAEPVFETKDVDVVGKILRQEVHHGKVTWTRRYRVAKSAAVGRFGVSGSIKYQVCDENQCLPPKTVKFTLGQLQSSDGSQQGAVAKGQADAPGSNADDPKSAEPITAEAKEKKIRSMGLFAFLLTAVTAGFLALLTPCVFPMIPITVSFFLKQSEREHHKPISTALIYCLGIVVTFTVLGILMAAIFGATSLNQLANNAWLNVGIAGVLIFFGMNLLGLFEIRVPSWMLTWSSNKEGQGGIAGTLFMSLTFTLVSFTCTFAFAGLLLVWAAKGDYYWPILGMLAFSAAFSFPFFFLALFPSYLKKLPKSGGWMNRVKVTMGFIELGAAFKFLSVADLAWNPVPFFFDYSLVMSAWMVISVCAGLYLLGLFHMSHDTPEEKISALRLASAMTFLGFAAYLAIGLFGAKKPDGAVWQQIAAFAPPQFEAGESDIGPILKHEGLSFALDYDRAVNYAKEQNLPLFLDFTGVNCVNCRKMEAQMTLPQNRGQLSSFVLVQLYTDNVPGILDEELAERLVDRNRNLQQDWIGDVTLPSYAIVAPDGDTVLSRISGYSSETVRFTEFLEKGRAKWDRLQAGLPKPMAAVASSK